LARTLKLFFISDEEKCFATLTPGRLAQEPDAAADEDEATVSRQVGEERVVGERHQDFRLRNGQGVRHALEELRQQRRATPAAV
jgi:hypothetical protein